MRTILVVSAVIFSLVGRTPAEIIAGPIANPANGHDYFLLAPSSWTAAEAEAESLGGTLAIVRNDDEHKWIYSTFGTYGGGRHSLWIGLHRKNPGGDFFWVNGAPVNYTNWYAGEPNNLGGKEMYVEMWGEVPAPGMWNDTLDPLLLYGVVEVSDKARLKENQRALTGDWYMSGRIDRPCHITETKDALFALNDFNSGGRIIFDNKGALFVTLWQTHGEVVQDKILWSNGTWWSRTPMDYQAGLTK